MVKCYKIMKILSISYLKEKWAHAGFQKYFINTGWMFMSKIICMTISFVTTIYIARNLGPENYGQLSYAVSFISIFGFIAALGIDNALYRDLIKNYNKKDSVPLVAKPTVSSFRKVLERGHCLF